MKNPHAIASETARGTFDSYEDSAQDVGHPDGQPLVETWPALIDMVEVAIETDRGQRIQVGNLVENIHQPGLDSRRVIALGGEGGNAWIWLDFQQSQLDNGELPTRLPLTNYRKSGTPAVVEISTLGPNDLSKRDWLVSWAIDSDELTPVHAARATWQESFQRGTIQPGPDDACIFTVTDNNTGASIKIDLSDEAYADHFNTTDA